LRRVLLIWPKRIDCPSLKPADVSEFVTRKCNGLASDAGLPSTWEGELSAFSRVSSGRESTAILIPIQVAIFLLITAVMVNWFVQMHQRNSRSWEAILARMSPACRLAYTSSAPSEALRRHWAQTPRAAFRDAGALMEMAEYAERNLLGEDPAKLQDIRHAALQLRLASTGAMIRRFSLR